MTTARSEAFKFLLGVMHHNKYLESQLQAAEIILRHTSPDAADAHIVDEAALLALALRKSSENAMTLNGERQ